MPCFTLATSASHVMISLPSIYLEEEALSFQKHTASSQNKCHPRLPANDVMRQVNCKVTGWLLSLLVAARPHKAELCKHMGCSLRSISSSSGHTLKGEIERNLVPMIEATAQCRVTCLGNNLILRDRDNLQPP